MKMSSCSAVEKGILERVIHRVPGNPIIPSKKEKQGYVDLSTKTKADILELIDRQNKLLTKRAFINNLPDKGEKITKYKNELEAELRKREKADELSDMLLKLNIDGKEALDELEWTGNCNPGQLKSAENITKEVEEDDVNDPLKMFATHSGTVFNQRINRILPPEETFIKPSDIEDLKEHSKEMKMDGSSDTFKINEDLDVEEPYIKHLCDKFDKFSSMNKHEKFLPHRTLKHHKETKNEETCKNPYWEVTAATPPPSIYKNVKLIPLETSVKLQIQQAENLKDVQMRHATEKLRALTGQGIGSGNWNVSSGKISQFRNPRTHYESSSSSSDEDDHNYHSCNEEDDPDEQIGGVTFYNLIDN